MKWDQRVRAALSFIHCRLKPTIYVRLLIGVAILFSPIFALGILIFYGLCFMLLWARYTFYPLQNGPLEGQALCAHQSKVIHLIGKYS